MTREAADSMDAADRLAAALVASIEAVDRDEADVETVALRYPEFATELREFFKAQECTKLLTAPLQALFLAGQAGNATSAAPRRPTHLATSALCAN